MNSIKNYKQLKKELDSIKKRLPRPPYCGPDPDRPRMYIDENGYFSMLDDGYFAPDEALRLGEFLVEFYNEK